MNRRQFFATSATLAAVTACVLSSSATSSPSSAILHGVFQR